MATQQESAVLSLYVYEVDPAGFNKPALPTGWTLLAESLPGTTGFAYAVFSGPGTEIVISFRGSDDGVDWLTNFGLVYGQEQQAAAIAAQYINQGANVSFTGHSLGGGLAATMAVWFNRPATVFDPAPTQAAATDPVLVNTVIAALGGSAPLSLVNYGSAIGTQFATRESNVVSYFAPGSVLTGIRNEGNTITGPGQATPVQFGIANMTSLIDQKNMHSQALLTAGLLSSAFKDSTVAVQRALPVMFDKTLYNLDTTKSDRNLFLDLIKSEQQTAGDGKLTHLAASFNKLGGNLSGLNAAAQDAIIAQTLEWYYWNTAFQNATTKQFFKLDAATGLLQYTTAQGAGFLLQKADLDNAQAKINPYLSIWLNTLLNQGAAQNSTPIAISYDSYQQWNVVGTTAGATANALDNSKSQAFVGNAGADQFAGSNKSDLLIGAGGADILQGMGSNDILIGGADADTLEGGTGNDAMHGGSGADSYTFSGHFGIDTVQDNDGQLKINAVTLNGGKNVRANLWQSDDETLWYLMNGADLIIKQRAGYGASSSGTVIVKNWVTGQLGISLQAADTPTAPTIQRTYLGDQRASLDGAAHYVLNAQGQNVLVYATTYNWASTSWQTNGVLQGGVAEANFNDVIYGGSTNDLILGLGGNDALSDGACDRHRALSRRYKSRRWSCMLFHRKWHECLKKFEITENERRSLRNPSLERLAPVCGPLLSGVAR